MNVPTRDPGDVYGGVLVGLSALLFSYFGTRGLWDYFHGSRNPGAEPLLCIVTLALVPFGFRLAARLLSPARPDDRLLTQPMLLLMSLGVLAGTAWGIYDGWIPALPGAVWLILGATGLIYWWRRRTQTSPP